MKTVESMAAQGDVLFIKVDQLPEGSELRPQEKGRAIVAHSETGHHHVALADQIRLYGTSDPMVCYLVSENVYTDVVHERPFDTHETLRLPPGVWQVKRQRELSPEGWRQVAD